MRCAGSPSAAASALPPLTRQSPSGTPGLASALRPSMAITTVSTVWLSTARYLPYHHGALCVNCCQETVDCVAFSCEALSCADFDCVDLD